MNARVRDLTMQKIPFLLVVGDKEAEAGTVNVRVRGQQQPEGTMPAEAVCGAGKEIDCGEVGKSELSATQGESGARDRRYGAYGALVFKNRRCRSIDLWRTGICSAVGWVASCPTYKVFWRGCQSSHVVYLVFGDVGGVVRDRLFNISSIRPDIKHFASLPDKEALEQVTKFVTLLIPTP